MNKPLSRRGFLGAAAAAPAVLQSLQAEVATETAMRALNMTVASSGAAPMAGGLYLLQNKALFALHAAGMLPEWAKYEIDDHINRESRYQMSPNVMALKSVTLAAKYRINTDRLRRQTWAEVAGFHARAAAREAFYGSPQGLPIG